MVGCATVCERNKRTKITMTTTDPPRTTVIRANTILLESPDEMGKSAIAFRSNDDVVWIVQDPTANSGGTALYRGQFIIMNQVYMPNLVTGSGSALSSDNGKLLVAASARWLKNLVDGSPTPDLLTAVRGLKPIIYTFKRQDGTAGKVSFGHYADELAEALGDLVPGLVIMGENPESGKEEPSGWDSYIMQSALLETVRQLTEEVAVLKETVTALVSGQ